MGSIDSGHWSWDPTTQAARDDALSQCRGWRGVLSFSFELHVCQGRVTLPCKSLRGVRAPNTEASGGGGGGGRPPLPTRPKRTAGVPGGGRDPDDDEEGSRRKPDESWEGRQDERPTPQPEEDNYDVEDDEQFNLFS